MAEERLLQFGIDQLMADGREIIVLLDADIMFHTSHWIDNIKRSLHRFACVQCFETLERCFTGKKDLCNSIVKTSRSATNWGKLGCET